MKPVQTFFLEHVATPTGRMLVVTDDERCLRALDWDDHEHRMRKLLRRHYGLDAVEFRDPGQRSAASDALLAYFEGETDTLAQWPVETNGTDFQRAVWRELRRIPFGQTVSYGALAVRIGRPAAVRAVGLANGANPIAIAVPCHRVIGANNTLTGFGGGIERKRWLLDYEQGAARQTNDLFSAGGAPCSLNPRIGT